MLAEFGMEGGKREREKEGSLVFGLRPFCTLFLVLCPLSFAVDLAVLILDFRSKSQNPKAKCPKTKAQGTRPKTQGRCSSLKLSPFLI